MLDVLDKISRCVVGEHDEKMQVMAKHFWEQKEKRQLSVANNNLTWTSIYFDATKSV